MNPRDPSHPDYDPSLPPADAADFGQNGETTQEQFHDLGNGAPDAVTSSDEVHGKDGQPASTLSADEIEANRNEFDNTPTAEVLQANKPTTVDELPSAEVLGQSPAPAAVAGYPGELGEKLIPGTNRPNQEQLTDAIAAQLKPLIADELREDTEKMGAPRDTRSFADVEGSKQDID